MIEQVEVSPLAVFFDFPAKKQSIVFRDQWYSTDAWLVCQQGAIKFDGQNEISFLRSKHLAALITMIK